MKRWRYVPCFRLNLVDKYSIVNVEVKQKYQKFDRLVPSVVQLFIHDSVYLNTRLFTFIKNYKNFKLNSFTTRVHVSS